MTTNPSSILQRQTQLSLELLGVLSSLLLAVLVIAFFVHTPWPRGDDYRFHVSIWAETAGRIHHLDIPRWNAEQAFGLGEPTYLFYPPLSIYLGGLLTLLFGHYWAAPILCGIVMAVAALSMRLCASLWLDPTRSWIVSLLYSANPYFLLCCWIRGSYAEILSAALFPLLIYFTSAESSRYRVIGCAFIFSLIWLSNLPSAVIISYAIAFYIAIKYFVDRDGSYAVHSAAGLCLGFGIAGFQMLPSVIEMRFVQIDVAVHGFQLSNFFVLGGYKGLFRSLIFAFLVCLFLAGVARFTKQRGSLPIIALGLLSSLMVLRYSSPFWKLLPLLANVQFPYRWLFVLAFVSYLVAGHLLPAHYRPPVGTGLVIAAFCVALAQCAGVAYWTASAKRLQVNRDSPASPDIQLLVGEYLPKTADAEVVRSSNNDRTLARTDVPVAVVNIRRWDPELRELSISSDQPAHVTLRLLNYPGWIATVNGHPWPIETEAGTGRAQLRIEPGTSLAQFRFSRTTDRNAGLAVTFISLALCAALANWIRLKANGLTARVQSPCL
jgi:hypothetical protein